MTRLDDAQIRAATLVVAHPDDEILFFSSIVRDVGRIVMALPDDDRHPDRSAARRRIIDRFPHDRVEAVPLSTPVASVFQIVDEETEFGLAIRDARARARYERTYALLREDLRTRLAGTRLVFTHNPWGEYGHADHVLVHRVVTGLADELGFEVWCSNYISARSLRAAVPYLASRTFAPPVEREVDRALAHEVKRLYVDEDCWTVAADFTWFRSEWFNRFPGGVSGDAAGAPFPVHFLHWWGGWERPNGVVHQARRRFRRLLVRLGLRTAR